MATQINLKFKDDFFEMAKDYADRRGYMSVQELVRDALRDKIFDDLEVRESYKKILKSKDANTFLGEVESKKFNEKMRKKAGM
ncbi:MAG: hypothetical protein ACOCZQ_03015 [Nanoarchaeota archaeon]